MVQAVAEVFGVKFSTGSMPEALDYISEAIRQNDKKCRFCAFINADCLNLAYKNVTYRAVLAQADRVWADGIGAAIAARYLKTPVTDNVNGTDMLPLLCRAGYKIYLLGGAPGVAERAAERLTATYPEVRIVGAEHGFFAGRDTEVIDRINRANPEILLVGLGAPRQELWIAEHLSELKCRVVIGVGGLLDFASGRIPRAPKWMRKLKIEWTYRLYQEPRRLFRRYVIGNPLFLWRVLLHGRNAPKSH
ncbi:MAG: WecB/TagA/CpsF family glycosyltransferase [Victivallales bacterium]|jgi:N-acetylglucosaminyldiphosphoundecaprenol N-acetyl-beta-D-mannosaminyltransferase|nr:WecB/TagA/CpsF family glycosyltransferase [Victivallales bacterium]